LLDETERLLVEARRLLESGAAGPAHLPRSDQESRDRYADAASIVGLYEALRDRLDAVDTRAVDALLARVASSLEGLEALDGEIGRLRRLRGTLVRL